MKNVKMSWVEFEVAVHDIADQIIKSKVLISNIYGKPRGGLILAVRLSHLLNKPIINKFYFADENTLWVDDVIDTGCTIHIAKGRWLIAVLYYNPKCNYKPDFYSLKKPKDSWIEFPWESK